MSYDYTFDGSLTFTPNGLRMATHDLGIADSTIDTTNDWATIRHIAGQVAELICDTFGTGDSDMAVTGGGFGSPAAVTVNLYGATQMGEEEQVLKTLAPYGSGAVYCAGESGDHWVWALSDGRFTNLPGHLVYPGLDDLDTEKPPV